MSVDFAAVTRHLHLFPVGPPRVPQAGRRDKLAVEGQMPVHGRGIVLQTKVSAIRPHRLPCPFAALLDFLTPPILPPAFGEARGAGSTTERRCRRFGGYFEACQSEDLRHHPTGGCVVCLRHLAAADLERIF